MKRENASSLFLSGIYIYPVKSLKGIALTEARVEERGLQHDRRWMLVDEDYNFFTQRAHPRLATVSVGLEPRGLTASAPGMEPLFIPFAPANPAPAEVRVWNDTCRGLLVSEEADRWFGEFLGTPCHLVYMPDDTRREVDHAFAQDGDAVSFADAYPFLLTTEASLEYLNGRLEASLPMNRFRPNLVVSGARAFEEDGWKKISVGRALFRVAKPCARCVVTTMDQERGTPDGPEPLRTLADFRLVNGKILFGQNLLAVTRGDAIRVGDRISVAERAD